MLITAVFNLDPNRSLIVPNHFVFCSQLFLNELQNHYCFLQVVYKLEFDTKSRGRSVQKKLKNSYYPLLRTYFCCFFYSYQYTYSGPIFVVFFTHISIPTQDLFLLFFLTHITIPTQDLFLLFFLLISVYLLRTYFCWFFLLISVYLLRTYVCCFFYSYQYTYSGHIFVFFTHISIGLRTYFCFFTQINGGV